MTGIDVSPFLKSMEAELRRCEGKRAAEILSSLERWSNDVALSEQSRQNAQRLSGKARFRLALASCSPSEATPNQRAILGRLRETRP